MTVEDTPTHTSVYEWITQKVNSIEASAINNFSQRLSLNPTDVKYYVDNYDPDKSRKEQIGEEGILSGSDYHAYIDHNPDATPLKYKRKVRESLPEFVKEKILPFRIK